MEIRVGTEKNEAKEYAQKFRELADIMDEIGRLDESENIESENVIEEYENLFNKFREKVNEIRKVWQSQKGQNETEQRRNRKETGHGICPENCKGKRY